MLSDGKLDQHYLANEFAKYWPPEMRADHRHSDIKWLAKVLATEWRAGAVSTKDLGNLEESGMQLSSMVWATMVTYVFVIPGVALDMK
jgi:hypothetical protein